MEHINCNLCGSNNYKFLFSRRDTLYNNSENKFNIVKCLDCGLVYVNPRPNEESIQSFYPKEYYEVDINREHLLMEKKKVLEAKYDKVKHIKPGRLLDIGCQKGEFLYYMKQKGWEVKGLELSPDPPNLFELEIMRGKLEDAKFPSQYFDMITLWAVLEHVYYPRQMLYEIYRILKPGGKIIILVTNFNSIPGRFMQHDDIPRHTTLFTKRTITMMMKLTGFKVDKVYFTQDIFGGSNRGFLNYLIKLLAGENLDDILIQNRNPDWWEFSTQIRGKESQIMWRINKIDQKITPYLDNLLDRLGFGFNMIVEGSSISSVLLHK